MIFRMDMKTNIIYKESCLDTCKRLADGSIDCVITSPPYWQLRDYGYPEQWGLEPTFQEYLQHLWSLMDAIYPKLKDGGTVWVNLGDTYARGARTKDGTNHTVIKTSKEHHIEPNSKPDYGGLDKCLLLIPHRFAIGCIDRGWIVRNDIIWAKRNGMPESVTDRFSKKHEYFFFMVKSEKYFFDLDAIKDKTDLGSIKRMLRGNNQNKYSEGEHLPGGVHANTMSKERQYRGYSQLNKMIEEKGLKNPGSVSDFWDIPTKPNSQQHYAQYSDSLISKPILAGCPEGGVIYDPFMGSGSTAEAALRAGRVFIGSEMSSEYYDIAQKRLRPLLDQGELFV